MRHSSQMQMGFLPLHIFSVRHPALLGPHWDRVTHSFTSSITNNQLLISLGGGCGVEVEVVVLLLDGVAAVAVAVLALKAALGLTADCPPNIWWTLFAVRRPLERAAGLVIGHGVASAAPFVAGALLIVVGCFGSSFLIVSGL